MRLRPEGARLDLNVDDLYFVALSFALVEGLNLHVIIEGFAVNSHCHVLKFIIRDHSVYVELKRNERVQQ